MQEKHCTQGMSEVSAPERDIMVAIILKIIRRGGGESLQWLPFALNLMSI